MNSAWHDLCILLPNQMVSCRTPGFLPRQRMDQRCCLAAIGGWQRKSSSSSSSSLPSPRGDGEPRIWNHQRASLGCEAVSLKAKYLWQLGIPILGYHIRPSLSCQEMPKTGETKQKVLRISGHHPPENQGSSATTPGGSGRFPESGRLLGALDGMLEGMLDGTLDGVLSSTSACAERSKSLKASHVWGCFPTRLPGAIFISILVLLVVFQT